MSIQSSNQNNITVEDNYFSPEDTFDGASLLREVIDETDKLDSPPDTLLNNPVVSVSNASYQARVDDLMSRANRDDQETFDAISDLVRREEALRGVEYKVERKRFEAAKEVIQISSDKLWEVAGYHSFKNYFSDPETPFSVSSAYRYSSVGKFMKKFELEDITFIRDFRKRFNMGFTEYYNPDGSINHEMTIDKNSIIAGDGAIGTANSVVRFLQVYNLASLFSRKKIGEETVLDLLHDAMHDNDDQWKARIKSYGSNVSSVDSKLADADFEDGISIMVAANDQLTLIEKLEHLLHMANTYSFNFLDGANDIDPEHEDTGTVYGKKSSYILSLPEEMNYPDESRVFLTRTKIEDV